MRPITREVRPPCSQPREGCSHHAANQKIRAPSVRHIMVFGVLPVHPRCGKNDFFVSPQCGNNDFSVRFQCVIMIFGALPLRTRCIPPSGNVFPMKFTDTAMRKFWPKTNQDGQKCLQVGICANFLTRPLCTNGCDEYLSSRKATQSHVGRCMASSSLPLFRA